MQRGTRTPSPTPPDGEFYMVLNTPPSRSPGAGIGIGYRSIGLPCGAGAGAGAGLLFATFGVKGPTITFDAGSEFGLSVTSQAPNAQ